MTDLLHKLVSAAIAGGLIALAGRLGAQRRRRKAAEAGSGEAGAATPTAVEDPSQAPQRHVRQADRSRDGLA